MLRPEDQRRYMEVERRFTTETWGWVRHWAQEQIDSAKERAALAESWEMNRMNVGFAQALSMLLAEEQVQYQEFDQLLAEAESQREDEEASHAGDLQL